MKNKCATLLLAGCLVCVRSSRGLAARPSRPTRCLTISMVDESAGLPSYHKHVKATLINECGVTVTQVDGYVRFWRDCPDLGDERTGRIAYFQEQTSGGPIMHANEQRTMDLHYYGSCYVCHYRNGLLVETRYPEYKIRAEADAGAKASAKRTPVSNLLRERWAAQGQAPDDRDCPPSDPGPHARLPDGVAILRERGR